MISSNAEYKPEEVFEVLQRVLEFAIEKKEFEYLSRGIGTATKKGQALLDAVAVVQKYGDKQ